MDLQPSYPPSKPQVELYHIVKQRYPDAELDYPVITLEGYRFIDIAVPSLMVGIEYNGVKWHRGKEKRKADRERKKELQEAGWYMIDVNKFNVLRFICYMPQFVDDKVRLLKK